MSPSITTVSNKKALFYAIFLLALAVLLVGSAEVILRANGVYPWQPSEVSIQVDPGGKFFRKHAALGYSHIPGKFTVTLGSGYSFNVTHLPNTLRITHPISIHKESKHREEIWIFGCSFTHGWSISDEETYPWLLQQRFPEYEITNYGVSGYGTIHSLLQFREALKTKAPKVAILAYAGFHDERNTFSRNRRKAVAQWNKLGPLVQPYARLGRDGGLQYFVADIEYREFPMTRSSALVHYIEMSYNQLESKWHQSHTVSERLVKEMAVLANQHGVIFIVANISGGNAMLDFAENNGITSIDISVDLELKENTNFPHDTHPSAIANQKYADKLGELLELKLRKSRIR